MCELEAPESGQKAYRKKIIKIHPPRLWYVGNLTIALAEVVALRVMGDDGGRDTLKGREVFFP